MAEHVVEFEFLGPWSLDTSRRFWEGFTPAALAGEPARPGLRTVFCAEGDWRRAEAEVTQAGDTAHVVLAGAGDLDEARRIADLIPPGQGARRRNARSRSMGRASATWPFCPRTVVARSSEL